MFRLFNIYQNIGPSFMNSGFPWWLVFLFGINLVLLALLIFIFPAILAYVFAAFLLFAGILLISWGLKLKKTYNNRYYGNQEDDFWIEVE